MKLRNYRIIEDDYSGYEAQIWRLWWPFWVTLGGINTFYSKEEAENYIEFHKKEDLVMETKSTSTGKSLSSSLLVAFIVLKLTGFIDWSWLWVLSPLWGQLVISVSCIIILAYLKQKEEREMRELWERRKKNRPKGKFQRKMEEMMKEKSSK